MSISIGTEGFVCERVPISGSLYYLVPSGVHNVLCENTTAFIQANQTVATTYSLESGQSWFTCVNVSTLRYLQPSGLAATCYNGSIPFVQATELYVASTYGTGSASASLPIKWL